MAIHHSHLIPYVLDVRNVHHALPHALKLMKHIGCLEESRNGSVLVAPIPVYTHYRCPDERVLFWSQRDANPFFHFFESLWMLAGRDDVEYPSSFAKQILNYSDDKKSLHGAYGYRWRHWFNHDQIKWAIKRLKADPNDRRVVITMWDTNSDMHSADFGGKDIPCNTQIYLRINTDHIGCPILCMQVNCRSNDILWGAYGANAVHMSFLQEYMAQCIGVDMGWYIQASFNWHVYTNFLDKMLSRTPEFYQEDDLNHVAANAIDCIVSPYERITCRTMRNMVHSHSLMLNIDEEGASMEVWDMDLLQFMAGEENSEHYKEPFFKNVALPMKRAHELYMEGKYDDAINEIGKCRATDWSLSGAEWLQRRKNQKLSRETRPNSKSSEECGS